VVNTDTENSIVEMPFCLLEGVEIDIIGLHFKAGHLWNFVGKWSLT
jgi:hypothetical protein